MLSTQIKIHAPDAQLIGLSAVLGGGDKLARWLNASLCSVPERPVELRKGIIHKGVFRYIEQNSKVQGTEPVSSVDRPALEMQVKHFVSQGEACIVFCKSRRECVEIAENLTQRLTPHRSTNALNELTGTQASIAKEKLSSLLQFGVAYHNSDLTWDLRNLVERHFRSGEIRVICATTTLAMGLNLPARNVFIDPYRWEKDCRTERFQKMPITQAEFENMSGRAGRLGQSHEFGRAIIVTESAFDAETYFRTFIQGSIPELNLTLKSDALGDHVLTLVASRRCATRGQLRTFLLSSYTGEMFWRGENATQFVEQLDEAIEHCIHGNLIRRSGSKLDITALGKLIAVKGVSAETGVSLAKFVSDNAACAAEVHPLELLLLLTDTDEGMNSPLKLHQEERFEGSLEWNFLQSMWTHQPTAAQRLRNYYYQRPQTTEQQMNLKRALLLRDWTEEWDFEYLENCYDCAPGAMRNMAAEFSWLCEVLEAIATLIHWPTAALQQIRKLARRLAHGVSAKALVFCEAKIRKLDRSHAAALAKRGILSLEEAADMPINELQEFIPRYVAWNLIQHVKAMPQSETTLATEFVPPTAPSSALDSLGNPWRAADVRINIAGRRQKQRAAILVNSKPVTLSAIPLETLLRLAVANKADGVGWLLENNFSEGESVYKRIERLREQLEPSGIPADQLIENDGAKRYRLSIPPAQIELDVDAILRSFPDVEFILKPQRENLAVAS